MQKTKFVEEFWFCSIRLYLLNMANNENFEPMQVDAAEENDNDGDMSISAFQHHLDGVANGISGGGAMIPPALIQPGKLQVKISINLKIQSL